MVPEVQPVATGVITAVEDIEIPLRNIPPIMRSYTAYLFRRLDEIADLPLEKSDQARAWVEHWRSGKVTAAEAITQLKAHGPAAIAAAADLLFESLEQETPDRAATEIAVDVLTGIRSSAAARVLAHVISEPALDEDLEQRAFEAVVKSWPLPRPFILSELRPHTHEDIPWRWFQVLIEAGEIYAVDLILEEFTVHGENPAFQPDLIALSGLLRQSRDPDAEDKIIQVLNAPETPGAAGALLQDVLKDWKPRSPAPDSPDSWRRLEQLRAINQKYVEASKLFDSGRKSDALEKITEILDEEPRYPLAVMLKEMM
jgi:hypothetical protein